MTLAQRFNMSLIPAQPLGQVARRRLVLAAVADEDVVLEFFAHTAFHGSGLNVAKFATLNGFTEEVG